MAHDIIMPALGMVQDTGIIVAWHKQPGDAVKATDVLMEVETDKATVEVEAGRDGFLASLRAETGVPIPVGEVVAVISDDKDEVVAAPADETKPPAETAPAAAEPAPPAPTEEPVVATPATATAPAPKRPPPRTGGRILASPKARRLAKERGIDLNSLSRLGVPEPIHVADLDKAGQSAESWRPSLMRVRIEREPFEHFLKWIEEEAGVEADGLRVWAAFATGSLRAATGRQRDDDIVVAAQRFPEDEAVALKNPDLANLSTIGADPADGNTELTVLDLTDTVLTEYRPAGQRPLPHLTVCNGQDAANYDLYLESDPAAMSAETAYALLKDLAERAQVPLRHLL